MTCRVQRTCKIQKEERGRTQANEKKRKRTALCTRTKHNTSFEKFKDSCYSLLFSKELAKLNFLGF